MEDFKMKATITGSKLAKEQAQWFREQAEAIKKARRLL